MITAQELPYIYADETQLVRLLKNLIDNYINYRGMENPRIQVTYR